MTCPYTYVSSLTFFAYCMRPFLVHCANTFRPCQDSMHSIECARSCAAAKSAVGNISIWFLLPLTECYHAVQFVVQGDWRCEDPFQSHIWNTKISCSVQFSSGPAIHRQNSPVFAYRSLVFSSLTQRLGRSMETSWWPPSVSLMAWLQWEDSMVTSSLSFPLLSHALFTALQDQQASHDGAPSPTKKL